MNEKIKEFNSLVQKIITKSQKVLLLISGGADSIFLFHLLIQYFPKLKIHLLHVNYQLRKEESQKDQEFIENLIANYQNKISLQGHFYSIKISIKGNIQKKARDIRYNLAQKISLKNKISIIFTAHHQNDLVENFFLKMIKGKNLLFPGLYQKEKIYRPLINIFNKEEIIHYLQKNKISYRQDQSNFENKYERNRIRNQIITLINKLFPESVKNTFCSIQYLISYQKILKKIIFDGNYFSIKSNCLFFTEKFFTFFKLTEQISLIQFYFHSHYPVMRISYSQYHRITEDLIKAFLKKKAIYLTIEKQKFYFQFPFLILDKKLDTNLYKNLDKKEKISFSFQKQKDYYFSSNVKFNFYILWHQKTERELQKLHNINKNKNIFFNVPEKYKKLPQEEIIQKIKIRPLKIDDVIVSKEKQKNLNLLLKKKKIPSFFRKKSYVLLYEQKIIFWFGQKDLLEILSLPYSINLINL